MCNFIGKFGTTTEHYKDINRYAVVFEDCARWIYPAELIKEHLVEEPTVPETITLPLINGVPDLSEFEGVEMLVSNDGVTWLKCKVLAYNSKQNWYVTPYDAYIHAKPLPEKRK